MEKIVIWFTSCATLVVILILLNFLFSKKDKKMEKNQNTNLDEDEEELNETPGERLVREEKDFKENEPVKKFDPTEDKADHEVRTQVSLLTWIAVGVLVFVCVVIIARWDWDDIDRLWGKSDKDSSPVLVEEQVSSSSTYKRVAIREGSHIALEPGYYIDIALGDSWSPWITFESSDMIDRWYKGSIDVQYSNGTSVTVTGGQKFHLVPGITAMRFKRNHKTPGQTIFLQNRK